MLRATSTTFSIPAVRTLGTWSQVTRVQLKAAGNLFDQPYLPARFSRPFTPSRVLLGSRKKKPPLIPSPAQEKIARLCREQNVVVAARPGSGKTAAAEVIISSNPDKRVAVVTYSRRLRNETYRRLHQYVNCKVMTFHEMACLLFGTIICDDGKLLEQRRAILDCGQLPRWKLEPFDIIVLDEFQDCTELLFWIVCCFIRANQAATGSTAARLIVLGDERQSIYRFRGADSRYLTLVPTLLSPMAPYPWASIPLSQSYRLSNQASQFINGAFLGGKAYIAGSKIGPKPIVFTCNPFDKYNLAKKLLPLVRNHEPKNTAILAPSIRTRLPISGVANVLAERYHIPTAVSISNDAGLDDKVIDGKMCISTIHQFKGSERDLVILFGIDASFFKFFGRDLPDDRCPNEIFVAITRAAKQLVLVHNDREGLMPFISGEALHETAEILDLNGNNARIPPPQASGRPADHGFTLPTSIRVPNITRHLRDDILGDIVASFLDVQQLSPPLPDRDHIEIPDVVSTDVAGKYHEAVSDLNTMVVIAACEHNLFGTLTTIGEATASMDTIPPATSPQYGPELCRRACDYEAKISGYRPRSIQMRGHPFDWIHPANLTLARDRLGEQIRDPKAEFEFAVVVEEEGFVIGNQMTHLYGVADLVSACPASDVDDGNCTQSVWEIRFQLHLSSADIVQACIYAYLLSLQCLKVPCIIIYNVRNGEKLEVTPLEGQEGLRQMIEKVLVLRHTVAEEVGNKDFIKECARVRAEVLQLVD